MSSKKTLYKCIIFDFDGTLYKKSNRITAIIDENARAFLSERLHENLYDLEKKNPNIISVLDSYNIKRGVYQHYVYDKIDYKSLLYPNKYLNHLLFSISCPKYIVSLSPRNHVQKALAALSMTSLFDEVYSLFEMYPLFEKECIYKKIVEAHSWAAEDFLCIGDSIRNDLRPAIRLGINCAYLTETNNLGNINPRYVSQFANLELCLYSLIANNMI